MTTEITTEMTTEITTQNISPWDCDLSLKEIRSIYAPKASEVEFKAFVQLGRATQLNPALREIWLVKYGESPASIFVGRDGYRRSSQANPNYDYHHVEAVYSSDKLHYDANKGEVDHKQDFSNRGNLIGAYCITKRKNSSKPVYVFVDLKEYTTGKSLWASKPATMIKKVAEAQCLRMAFQELFGGTYSDAETGITEVTQATIETQAYHKQFEGTPLSQTFTMDPNTLEAFLSDIQDAPDKPELQERYRAAKEAAKGDKIASNKISIATKERLAYFTKLSEEVPVSSQSREEFFAEYDKTEVK